jgi:hypothetical protein
MLYQANQYVLYRLQTLSLSIKIGEMRSEKKPGRRSTRSNRCERTQRQDLRP